MALSSHSTRFVIVVAHVVLLAYFFQISAIDHWHSHVGDIVGVEGTNAHVMHCHGAGGGCADGATDSPFIDATALILIPPAPLSEAIEPSFAIPGAVYLASPDQPPRAA